MRFGCEKTNEGGIKKRRLSIPDSQSLLTLNLHNVFSKIFYLLTLINFESSVFLLLHSLISHTSGEMSDIRMETWFRHLAGYST